MPTVFENFSVGEIKALQKTQLKGIWLLLFDCTQYMNSGRCGISPCFYWCIRVVYKWQPQSLSVFRLFVKLSLPWHKELTQGNCLVAELAMALVTLSLPTAGAVSPAKSKTKWFPPASLPSQLLWGWSPLLTPDAQTCTECCPKLLAS